MDYPDFIFAYWKKEQQAFRKNLAILKQHPDKDAVHDIRVTIKKLRAALQLYVLISGEPLWKYPLQETDSFFSILGKQRDIEICLELLTAFENEIGKKYTELNHYFQSVLAVAYKWTRDAVKKYQKNSY
jgi:CHAD domain-containing protein